MEEMGVGSSRAKRYSSQRQRAVPEPAPPLHLGVIEGHFYEPSKIRTSATRLNPVPKCLSSGPTSLWTRVGFVQMY